MPGTDGETKETTTPEKRDLWYKLRAVGGISTAVVAALIGVLGSIFLNQQQETSNKVHLYTQLMSEQEKAENAVRKDMFTAILSSFLDKDAIDTKECAIDKINRQLLELEMISRNFHETMDLRPLFIHVLLNIVRDIPQKYSVSDNDIDRLEKTESCKNSFFYRLYNKKEFVNADHTARKELVQKYIDNVKKKNLNKINSIAKRITTKQLESLTDVHKRLRFTVNLGQTQTCSTLPIKPTEDMESCDKTGSIREPETLTLDDNKDDKKKSHRTFTIFSNRSYKEWNQVRIKVSTNKTDKEIEADKDGEKSNTAEFWLGFFDFPLVDNTFLSNKERYAVILDSIDDTEAKVSLLYFPASYAGFKEKSYYQNRIINTLLKDASINN